jgi:hypothetical protein
LVGILGLLAGATELVVGLIPVAAAVSRKGIELGLVETWRPLLEFLFGVLFAASWWGVLLGRFRGVFADRPACPAGLKVGHAIFLPIGRQAGQP